MDARFLNLIKPFNVPSVLGWDIWTIVFNDSPWMRGSY